MVGVRKTLAIWLMIEAVYVVSLMALPHNQLGIAGFLNYSLQTLLFLVSLGIAKHEAAKSNKFIFANFALFFSTAFLAHIFAFVGTIIPTTLFAEDGRFARMLLDQYIFRGAYFFLMGLAVVYVSLDLVFRDSRVVHKYAATILIVGAFFTYYYWPFFQDPLYLHHTETVEDWRKLDNAFALYKDVNGKEPTVAELAKAVQLRDWRMREEGRSLTDSENLLRVESLYPYLFGLNWRILVYRPLTLNQIYMSVVCVGFLLLFFGYQFLRDPPQGAYIEKIMFLLLVFCSLEVFHASVTLDILQWSVFKHFYTLGQFFSLFVLALVALFFLLRLKFITSVNGEFYEQELASRPASITRWRDTVDNLVIQKFFNPKIIIGRMLVDPSRR